MSLIDKKPIGETLLQINQLLDNTQIHQQHIPSKETITKAKSWIVNFYRLVKDVLWFRPIVSVNEGREVYFEWWNNKKKLIILINHDQIKYIQSCHAKDQGMSSDGNINFLSECYPLWLWLIHH